MIFSLAMFLQFTSFNRGQAVYPPWWPSLTKDKQTEPNSFGVVRETQSTMVHTREKIL